MTNSKLKKQQSILAEELGRLGSRKIFHSRMVHTFHGLPGLILEMEDSTGTHAYKFVGSKKFDDIEKVEKKEELAGTKPGTVIRTF